MPNRELAQAIHREFKAKPESKHIASEFALIKLAEFLCANRIESAQKTRSALSEHLERSGLTIDLKGHYPDKRKISVTWRRRLFGIPLPRIKRRALKGCFIGQVVRRDA